MRWPLILSTADECHALASGPPLLRPAPGTQQLACAALHMRLLPIIVLSDARISSRISRSQTTCAGYQIYRIGYRSGPPSPIPMKINSTLVVTRSIALTQIELNCAAQSWAGSNTKQLKWRGMHSASAHDDLRTSIEFLTRLPPCLLPVSVRKLVNFQSVRLAVRPVVEGAPP